MKKLLVLFMIIVFWSLPTYAGSSYFLAKSVVAGGGATDSNIAELGASATSQKILFFWIEPVAGVANIAIKVYSGFYLKPDSGNVTPVLRWSPTQEFTLTMAAGILSLDGVAVPNPFCLVTNNYADQIKVNYNVTTGKIKYINLKVSK